MSKEMYLKASELFEKGNFHAAGKTLKELKASKPTGDMAEKTDALLEKLKIDKVEIITGIVAFLLLTFLYVFFGLIR